MRKGKKVIALLLGMSMIATCFSACGGDKKDGGEDPDAKRIVDVKLDEVDTMGIEKPAEVADNADAEQISLKVWCPSEEQKITEQLCDLFDKSHPEYKISFDFGVVSEDQAQAQVTLDPNAAADVFMFAGDQLSKLVEGKYVSELAESVANSVKDTHIEDAYNSCTIDGKAYAVPFTANLWYMFYNKDMLADVDVTSLDAIFAKDFPDTDKGEHVYNFAVDLSNGWYIAAFYYAGGCSLFGDDGTDPKICDWAEEKGIKVLDYLNEKVATQKWYCDESYEAIDKMRDGVVAAYCTGSWNALAVKEALGDKYAATCAPKITIDGKEEWLKPFADFKMIGVNGVTKNPKAAQLLAEFLGGDYAQMIRLQTRQIQPTVKQLVEDSSPMKAELDYEKNYPAVQASLDQMAHTVNRPKTSQIVNYWTPAQALGGAIYQQKEDVLNADRANYVQTKIISKIVSE